MFVLQGIVPESATTQVKELFVPETRVVTAREEAARLATLDVTEVISAASISNRTQLMLQCLTDAHNHSV